MEQNLCEEQVEENGRKHTSLLHSVGDGEGVRVFSVREDLSSHVVMEKAYERGEFSWTAELEEDGPESLSVDRVKRLREVYEHCV